jgi:DNA invertase Pin-like site-specific DNA recombinase
MDSQDRRRRIAAARKRREAEGLSWGRPHVIDAATVARARAMQAEGRKLREIAAALHVKLTTLHRALHRPASAFGT